MNNKELKENIRESVRTAINESEGDLSDLYKKAKIRIQMETGREPGFDMLNYTISDEAESLGLPVGQFGSGFPRAYEQMVRRGFQFYEYDEMNDEFKKIHRSKMEPHNVKERIKFNIENSQNDNARELHDYITSFLSILIDTLQFYNGRHL